MKAYALYHVLACFLLLKSSYGSSWEINSNGEETHNSEEFDNQPELIEVDFNKYKHEATINEYPYHIGIILKPLNVILCQGALVASKWILTSASCLKKYSMLDDSMYIVAGVVNALDTNAVVSNITDVAYYPLFRPVSEVNDLALVKLNSSIFDKFNDKTKTIDLSEDEYAVGTKCDYSSYERLQLYGYRLKLLNSTKCDKPIQLYAQKLKYYCVGAADIQFKTNSDIETHLTHIGTPLVCNNKLFGIKTQEGVFTAVNKVQSWLKSIIH